jgi:hypothetical protein
MSISAPGTGIRLIDISHLESLLSLSPGEKKMRVFTVLIGIFIFASTVFAQGHAYLAFDDDNQLIMSGPFSVTIPVPGGARAGEPAHDTEHLMGETLLTSRAGYFNDDQFLVIEVETTDAPTGTIDYGRLPIIEMAGSEYHSRVFCFSISEVELQQDDKEPVVEFILNNDFDITPAVYARQLLISTDDGTGETSVLYGQRVASCDAVTPELESDFDLRFEKFVKSVREANQ